jgi:glycosyltransferase involved in cell wall biosynthesis
MKLGYLHIGSPEHGICRYGHLLAFEAQRHPELSVVEISVTLTANHQHNNASLINAARCLSEVDLVHLQYSIKNNKGLWGQGWSQLTHLKLFREHCQQPLVVTFHDVYDVSPNPQDRRKYFTYFISRISSLQPRRQASPPNHALSTARLSLGEVIKTVQQYRWRIQKEFLRIPDHLSLHLLLNEVQQVYVASSEEAKRLSQAATTTTTQVIPHFVEQRSQTTNKLEAQKALSLDGYQIVTLLGFIHGRKGHQLMISAISKLPQHVKVIFAGGASPGQENFLQQLLSLATSEGVSDRLSVTGYLPEEDLELYLMATDLAICPFESFSASGSLSTWISVACPILAYALPQIAEYNQLFPDSIQTFQPYTPDALANAITSLLSIDLNDKSIAVNHLRAQLLLPEVFNRHLSCYRQLVMMPCLAV